jgi:hypothetical protein
MNERRRKKFEWNQKWLGPESTQYMHLLASVREVNGKQMQTIRYRAVSTVLCTLILL